MTKSQDDFKPMGHGINFVMFQSCLCLYLCSSEEFLLHYVFNSMLSCICFHFSIPLFVEFFVPDNSACIVGNFLCLCTMAALLLALFVIWIATGSVHSEMHATKLCSLKDNLQTFFILSCEKMVKRNNAILDWSQFSVVCC